MIKADFINAFREATGISDVEAKEYLERMGDIIAAELLGGGEIPLPRLGKLHVKATKARPGRNPRTGETVQIPAGKKVAISLGKDFKESLNQTTTDSKNVV